MTLAPNKYYLDAETKASGMGGKSGTHGTEGKYVPNFEKKKERTEGNCDCVGYHSSVKMVKLGCGLNPSDSETSIFINIACNISVFCQIQSGARNVVPLIVQITHFYYYKNI